MSLLDAIKQFFCSKKAEQPIVETTTEATAEQPAAAPAPEVKPEPVTEPEATAESVEPVSEPESKPEPTPAPIAEEPTPVEPAAPVATVAVAEKEPALQIPQDSALRRHFISGLKAQIESELPPRPSDSTLKRHYDATVQAKLDELLS